LGTVLTKITERERQAQFLETLLKDGTGEAKRLKERILQAQHDEHCIRRALILMVLVGVVSIVGLGYSAVLLPHFFDNATPLLVKVFCALGLGSLICMMIFGVCWLWYRKASNEINEACRDYIVHELKNRETVVEFPNPVTVNKTFSEVYQIRTPDSGEDSRIIQFPRAS
jgi:ABC-type multidrug transport system fused ATPase/permease subunit